MSGEWRDQAACKGMDTLLFFPTKGQIPRLALATCALCPVSKECRAEADTDKPNILGVWGGTSHRERLKPGYKEVLKRHRALPKVPLTNSERSKRYRQRKLERELEASND